MTAKSGQSALTSFTHVGIPPTSHYEPPLIAEDEPWPDVEEPSPNVEDEPRPDVEEPSPNVQALSRPKKQYSKLGLFLRQKVRTPVQAILQRQD